MSDIVEKMKDGIDPSVISVDDIRRNADDVRKSILDDMKVEKGKTAPNVFRYSMNNDSIGLNEISNVDMGYAGTSVDFAGEHLSKRNPYIDNLEYNVGLMEDSDNAVVVINGGLFTYIPKTMNGKLLSYQDQIAYFYSLFKDLAKDGKILALVRGTEEHRILKNHSVDMMGILQEALGLDQKVCNDALINLQITDDIVGKADVGIRTINWNNSATTGAYIGRKMEERATKRGGADIYLARTTMNYFKTAIASESKGTSVYKRPIYLVSGGSYTPFKGAMTAGAEYNSIKDGELPPNSFWYKVTVEEAKNNEQANKNYVVRVNPIQYTAHQINLHGTDGLVARIENEIETVSDGLAQSFMGKYAKTIEKSREDGRRKIREILIGNKSIAESNSEFEKYLLEKKSFGSKNDEKKKTIIDLEQQHKISSLEEEMI